MIVVATCDQLDHPTPSIDLLLKALRSRGLDAEHKAWRTTSVGDFAAAELVLPLCFWDHHGALAHFIERVGAVESAGGRLLNHPEILRWNFRKTYLLEVQRAGLSVPPTVHLNQVDGGKVERLMRQREWDSVVVKPVSGQDGHGLVKLEIDERDRWPDLSFPGQEALVQAFQPDIATFGETTLTFFAGEFSHAVRRVPAQAEWRANRQFGVQVEAVSVTDNVVADAKHYLACVPGHPLYARVDGIVRPDGFLLMELELIDPYLYLEFAPGRAADTLARLIAELVNDSCRGS
jgi:glutathione synthase/RimK-type ligase-like ATP-grasp enzyme